ncbi:MAG: HAD family hydrolase [Patescibacteria group bacterium]|nr:HAD family hydrolase [Patescibacteria group bacterium]
MLDKKIIKFVGFDLDQTLYEDNAGTHNAYRSTLYRLLAKELGIGLDKAEKEFKKLYKVLGSGTEVARVMGVKNPEMLSAKVSNLSNMHKYIKRDEKLVKLIEYLDEKYELFLITASAKKSSGLKLEKLGFGMGVFKHAICSGTKGWGKTTGKSFSRLLKLTKARPREHVFVGDRDVTDILPAKRAGMQTVMVWGRSKNADLSIKTIYELENYL